MTMEQFHHEIDGSKITLPRFDSLPFGVMRKIRKEEDGEAMFLLIEQVADAKNLARIDKLTMPQVGELMEAWQKDSGVDMGESEASSAS